MAETEMLNNNNCDKEFFEGVEKLLEIWFVPNDTGDLRKITRKEWESLLQIVRCAIISYTHSEHVDAYVLSESSMFVSQRRLILKTCGTTTPLECLRAVLTLAAERAGHHSVENVFYSRRNFARPHLQAEQHRDFKQEVDLLHTFFKDGTDYVMGNEDKDCWYMYTLLPPQGTVKAVEWEDRLQRARGGRRAEADQTIEMLMSDLDPEVMAIFTKMHCKDAKEATKKSGIEKIIPGMKIDDFLFDPCGYSMNAVTDDGCYMTIHITPEPEFSYVSFESNIALDNYVDVITRVIDTFRPKKFVLTLFANEESIGAEAPAEMTKVKSLGSYKREDMQLYRLCGYDLHYALYCKFPS